MTRIGTLRGSALLVAIVVAAGLTATLLLTRSGNASGSKGGGLVKTAQNAALGKQILVTRSGLTLYSLSAERHGRFICTTTACLSIWKPLVARRGMKPAGLGGLATVKRPDGSRQVAFRGAPLYRFAQDTKPGDVMGNGFRDVGVWRPVVANGAAAQSPAPAPAPSRGVYGY